MVSKFKFELNGHNKKKLALCVPRFNSDGPPKSGASKSKILRSIDFQALDPNFCQALEPNILDLEGSSYGNRPSIYALKGCHDETPQKVVVTVILGAKAFLPPPVRISYSETSCGSGLRWVGQHGKFFSEKKVPISIWELRKSRGGVSIFKKCLN